MSGIEIIPGGSALPLSLVQALEAERLVFFCGAGISMGTGLPDFRRLTLEAIDRLDGAPNMCPTDPALRDAFCITQQYEKALDILERKIAGNGLREYVADVLTKAPTSSSDLPLHKAILALAKRRPAPDGNPRGYRLVTTNYDDRFELAGLDRRWMESAPHLSRPRGDDERAGYVTFIHGRIEKETSRDPAHRELVLTSADFGNAYLRDGFAARFVLELFREFTVLFIGYSINDPVMRYLVDIFATEQRNRRKGQFNEAFAIASFKAGREANVRAVWQAKNVTPILYDDSDHHRRLTELMTAWSGLHTAGADGRFSKFLEITRQPYSTDPEDRGVRTAAWALADERGRTAERLASLTSEHTAEAIEDNANATPDLPDDAHISWLGPLLQAEVLDPRDHRHPSETCKLSDVPDVARHLCRWAVRHLETRELVEWAIDNQGVLLSSLREPFFEALIRRMHGQRGLPPVAAPYCTFWEVLIEIAVRLNTTKDWRSLFRPGTAEPGTPESVMCFIQRSDIGIAWPSKPWRWVDESDEEGHGLSRLARFELAGLGGRDDLQRFKDLFADPVDRERARGDLAPYLDDLTSLLLAICRLGRMIEAPFATGWSIDERPSIQSDESNNLELADLSWLIEAIVLSFARATTDDADNAVAAALRWRHLWRRGGFSLFGRLYLHAATVLSPRISADRLVDDLLDPTEALWSAEYRAEVLPVLRLRVAKASHERQEALVGRLLESPPADIFREDSDVIIERFRGQRLAWLKLGGVTLERKALEFAEAYLAEKPLPEDPRADEVFYVRHTTRVGTIGSGPSLVGQPIDVILESLRAEHDAEGWPIHRWDRARRVDGWLSQEPQRVVEALDAFAREPSLPDGALDGVFWALRSLKPDQLEAGKLGATVELVLRHDDRLIAPTTTAVAGWLENIASWPEGRIEEESFFALWDCTFDHAPKEEMPTDENADLNSAINAVGGKLAEALRDCFWLTKPRVGQGLPDRFKSRLERLIHGETLASLHARLVYMQSLDPLFAVDAAWTREHLLPRLSWQGAFAEQATWHWRAHLLYGAWSLQLSQAYRADFLETLGTPADRGSDTFRAACQRFAALGAIYGLFSEPETRQAFQRIGPEGGVIVLETLSRRLIESEEPAEMWRKSITPWLQHWPHDGRFNTERMAKAAAELIIEADDAFPDALDWIERRGLIRPFADRYGILWRLTNEEQNTQRRRMLADRYSAELSRFLSQILFGPPLRQHERQTLTDLVRKIERNLDPNQPPPASFDQLKQLL